MLFIGGHTKGLDQVVALVENLPHFISGIYLQMTPVATINGALEAAGEQPLDVKPVDNHLTWISRALAARSAA